MGVLSSVRSCLEKFHSSVFFSFIIRNEKRASKVFSFFSFSMGSYSLLFFSCCLFVAAVVVVQQRVQWQLSNAKRNCHENLWRATKFLGVCTSCWMVYKTAPLRTMSFKRFPFSRLFLFFLVFGDDDQIHLNSKKLIYNMNILISFSLVSDDGGMNPPINLPASLESLPRAEHFPTQRHRWNTNEVFLSFFKEIKTYTTLLVVKVVVGDQICILIPRSKLFLGNSIKVGVVLMTY